MENCGRDAPRELGGTEVQAVAAPAEEPALSEEIRRAVEGQVNRLPEELEKRCARHVAEVKKGFLKDAVLLCDRIASFRLEAAASVESLEREALELLARAGLAPVKAEGQKFNPSIQKAVATEPAPTEEQDGQVARVVRPGYRSVEGGLFRPEEVVVYRWEGKRDE